MKRIYFPVRNVVDETAQSTLSYAPDAWVDPTFDRIGCEISFTRYFYKPQPMRTLDEIRADIVALEKETDGLLDEILRGGMQ